MIMSNRVMNLFPVAAPQSKTPGRRSEPPAEDVSFERSLKKATPSREQKPKEAEPPTAREPDRATGDEAPVKKKTETTKDAPVDSSEEAQQGENAEAIDKPEDKISKSDDEGNELAAAADAVKGFSAQFTLAENEQKLDSDAEITPVLVKNEQPAKPASTTRALKVKEAEARPDIDPSADETADHGSEVESMSDELTLLQRGFETLSEEGESELSPAKTIVAGSSSPAVKPQIELQSEPAVESASIETPKMTAEGDADAEMQQQPSFHAESTALQEEAGKGLKTSSESGSSDVEPFADLLAKAPGDAARMQPVRVVQSPIVPERVFADANHPQIVSSVKQELLPHGGTMQLRLDPPQLGALQVTVEMRDGVMIAAFQTSNDEATRLLSHSLHQLKQSLESQGVSVDRMHVQQAPRDQEMAGNEDGQQRQQSPTEQNSARQEQQRREMMQRLWRRLAGTDDFLDLVA
jgi:flagellar hook-length control protein FliK